MKHLKLIICFILLLASKKIFPQDTLTALSAQQVNELVKQFHPLAKQANILIEKAKADITISKGLFDPSIKNDRAQKTFDGTKYYYYNRSEISIPTWFGAELAAGLENLNGFRTSPEETKGKTSYFGIDIPLAKNLLLDKRRAALQAAKIYRDASEIEKRNIVNDLLLDANKAYWNWAQKYQLYKISSNAVVINEQRVRLIKSAFIFGDRPAIDTIEALSQLQNFELMKSQSWLEFQNAGLELSLYLWTAATEPYYLPETVTPEDDLQLLQINELPMPELSVLLTIAQEKHPDLQLYDFKLDVLDIEKKLKFQELLPAVNFRYNQLGKGYNVLKTTSQPLFENNYQYGVSLSLPLRLSQGRGEYKKAKLKIVETELLQKNKQLQVANKIKSYYNELVSIKSQVAIQEKAYKNFVALQQGEEIRFKGGESSLFLINSRENKALEALQKLQELKVKYLKTNVSLIWASGMLN